MILGIDEALTKLRTDYIDIVHLHSCLLEVLQRGEVIEALTKSLENGKIRVAAYSGENDALAFAVSSGKFGGVQFSLNLFDQRSIDKILPLTIEQNIGVIAKRPIANVSWRFSNRPLGEYCEEYWLRMKKMNLQLKMDRLEAAIRFAAYTNGVCSCIIGSSSINNIKQNIMILKKGKLPDGLYSYIRKSFKQDDNGWMGQV